MPNSQAQISQLLAQGLANHRLGALSEAAAFYEQALALDSKCADAMHLSGLVLLSQGDAGHAIERIRGAIECCPSAPLYWANLGGAHAQMGSMHESIKAFNQALILSPTHRDALRGRALALERQGDLDGAARDFMAFLAHGALDDDVLFRLGVIEQSRGKLQEALVCYGHVAQSGLHAKPARTNAAVIHKNLGQLERAVSLCESVLLDDPYHLAALTTLGLTRRAQSKHRLAMACFSKALAAHEPKADLLVAQGLTLHELGEIDAAKHCFLHALRLEPNHLEAKFCLALTVLLMGDLLQGMPLYEHRLKRPAWSEPPELEAVPRWSRPGKTPGGVMLVLAEQGLGDTLNFCCFAQLLAAQGQRIVFKVQPTLKTLLTSALRDVAVTDCLLGLPSLSAWAPLMSLPYLMGLDSLAAVRGSISHVKAWPSALGSPSCSQSLRADRVRAYRSSGALCVGIVWSGSPNHDKDRLRSISFRQFKDALPEGPNYVCLQPEFRHHDLASVEAFTMLRFEGELKDFADTAALIRCLDLVISVDSAVAHLAGVLRVPVWILLPIGPDWRWQLGSSKTLWYEHAKLYRQIEFDDWSHPLAAVRQDLHALIQGR